MTHAQRWGALVLALALTAAACGNSGDDGDDGAADTTEAPSDDETTDDTDATDGADGDRDTFVPLQGVPGVTDEEIGYAVIGTRSSNPLGTCVLDCYLDGIEAYFAYRNSEGGIYGRDLVVSQELDDELGQNQARALEVISGDNAFGAFNGTFVATGFADLDEAGVPTYVWGINSEEMAGREHIFGNNQAPCADCGGRTIPWAVQEAGASRVASLGYGADESSAACVTGSAASVERYADDIGGAEVVYTRDDLAFGLDTGIAPEVTAMREADVDFIAGCIDLNGMQTLAQELQRQGMDDVTLYHPNTYNQQFVSENANLFEGDIVTVGFRPLEADPGNSDLGLFIEWMDETGAELSELAMVGWINADLAFQGLLAAGPEFDRESVVAATNAMTDYDAGGLINPIDWTRQHVIADLDDPSTNYEQECAALVRIVDGAFETIAPPEEPWLCWPNDSREWSEPTPTSFGE